MESQQNNRRGILRLAYVLVMIGIVTAGTRVQAGAKWDMSVNTTPFIGFDPACSPPVFPPFILSQHIFYVGMRNKRRIEE